MRKIYLIVLLGLMMGPMKGWGQYSGVGSFTQITSIAELTDGYYVFAFGTTFAMNNTNGGTFFGNTGITPVTGTITNPATSIVWKIQTDAGGRTIYNEASSTYASYTGTANAAQAVGSVASDNQRWTFAWASTVFTVTNLAITTRLLQYNTGSPRFACYTGTQQNITLYKLSATKYWDVLAGASNGTGGAGTWGTTFSNSSTGDAALSTAGTSDNIIYQATAGVVTLAASQTAASHTFNVNGYSIATSGGNWSLAGSVALGAQNLTFAPAASNILTIPGVISGSGGSITQDGAGTTTLGGVSTFTGATTITNGTLQMSVGTNRLPAATAVSLANTSGATLDLNSLSQTIGSLAGGGTNGGNVTLGSGTLTVGNASNTTYAGIISGTGGLTKQGTGTLTLSRPNTYTGSTAINAGAILLNGGSLTSNTSIASGATLSSVGTAGTSGNLAISGNVAPGGSAAYASLNVGGTLTWNGGGSYQFDISKLPSAGTAGTDWDLIAASGAMITPASGSFTVAVSGTLPGFDNLTNYTWQIGSYVGGTPAATNIVVTTSFSPSITFAGTFSIVFNSGNINLVYTQPSPSITVSVATLTGLSYVQNNGPSASQNYSVSGAYLTPAAGNVTITPSANYFVSTDNITFSSTAITVAYTGSTLAATPIYVRLKAGLSVGAYNSETIANSGGGVASAVNVTVSGSVIASNSSDIAFNAASTTSDNTNIIYTRYYGTTLTSTGSTGTPNDCVGVMGFYLRDGGSSLNDADNLSTDVTAITFSVTNSANIRFARLFDGNTPLGVPVAVTGGNLVFTGLTGVTAADGTQKAFNLRVTFNTAVTDNQQMLFTVTSVTAGTAASGFAAANGGGAFSSTTGDINRIEVDATKIVYGTQPASTSVNTNLAAFNLRFVDDNGNLDFDNNRSVTLAATDGGVNMTSSASYTLTAPHTGIINVSNVQFTTGPQTNISITATTSGLITNTIKSTLFNITTLVNGDWYSVAGTGLNWNVAASWQRVVGGVLSAAGAAGFPSTGVSDVIYITNGSSIIGNGSRSAKNLTVESGGYLTIDAAGTISTSLLVKDGGTLEVKAALTVSTAFNVEDNGTVIINYLATNGSAIWDGIENFGPNSLFKIKEWGANNGTIGLRPLYNGANVSTNTYNGYTAAFGNIEIDLALSSQANSFFLISTGVSANLAHGNLNFMNPNSAGDNISILSTGTATSGIGGNFIMDDLFSPTKKVFFTTSGSLTFTIKGKMQLDGATASLTSSTTANNTNVTVEGDIVITAGAVLELGSGIAATPTSTLNLKGDLSVVASGLLQNANTSKVNAFNFTGIGDGLSAATTQTIDIASTSTLENRYIAFSVGNGAYVQLANRNFELGISSSLAIENGGVFDFGFSSTNVPLNLTKTATASATVFNLKAGGTIKITSDDAGGAIRSLNVSGNLQLDTRTYDGAATYHYIGKSSQITGDGLPAAVSAKKVIVELNTDALTLSATASTFFNASGTLEIRKGTVIDNGTKFFADGAGAGEFGNLVMSGGLYQFTDVVSTAASTIFYPRLSGNYSLTGGIVELAANTTTTTQFQRLRGGKTYYNLTVSGASSGGGYKNISSAIGVSNKLTITGSAIFDTDNSGVTGAAGLTMDGGRWRISKSTNAQPELTGVNSAYAITGGVIEYYGSAIGSQTINGLYNTTTPIEYNQIEVTGNNVANSNNNITLRSGGIFTVKTNGVFTINDNAIVGVVSTPQTVVVENGGLFKTGDIHGFSGGTGLTTTSVRADIETVTLQTGSTVEYTRADPPLTGGDQVITNAHTYQNLTISGTGNKTPVLNGTVTVQGNLSKTGSSTFVHNSSEVLFNNTTATQTFSNTGTTAFNFYNLTNSNTFSTGLNIDGDCGVANGLSLTASAKLNLLAGNITLLSDNTRTAYVNTIPATASIAYTGAGKFVVQRYLPIPLTAPARRWRLLTAPIKTTAAPNISTAWQEGQSNASRLAPSDTKPGFGTIITRSTTAANGYDQGSTNNPSIYKFDGSQPAPWQSLLATNTGTITDQEGYMIFVRGNRNFVVSSAGVPGSPTTLRVSGLINTGNISKALDPLYPKLIGNPYPSAISFNKILVNGQNPATTAGITFYLWDPKFSGNNNVGGIIQFTSLGTGFYTVTPSAVAGSSNYTTNIYDGAIESGAAFLMAPSAGNIDFTEASKIQTSSTQGIASRPTGEQAPIQKTAFFTTNLLSGSGRDAAVIDGVVNVCRDDFDNKADEKDGPKLITFQTAEKLSLLREEKLLGIELRKGFEQNDSIIYQLSKMKQENYQLAFIQSGFKSDLRAIAEDKFTGKKMLLSSTDTTLLPFAVTSNPASAAADRFKVVFKSAVTFNTLHAAVVNADVKVEWNLANEFDVNSYEVERSADGNSFTTVSSIASKGNSLDAIGYAALDLKPVAGVYWYRIKSVLATGNVYYSDKVQVKVMSSKANMYVFPNPVTNGNIGLQLNNLPQGKYAVRLLNELGQTILSKQLVHSGGTASHNIAAPATSAGTYQMEVTAPDKKPKVIKVVIQ